MASRTGLGSGAHQKLIEHVATHYRQDDRIRAVAVFGSVSDGTWHELSDVDFDIVTDESARIDPVDEIAAMFGRRAVIVLARADSADVVLTSGEELSIRWHTLQATSPNITATVRVVLGHLTDRDLAAAGDANRTTPESQRLLDASVRDAIGARKALVRGMDWLAVALIERMRSSLAQLRGRRDGLQLDPSQPARALAAVLATMQAEHDLGPRRRALLENLSADNAAGLA